MEPQIFLTALLLLALGCEVLGQRVDYLKQSTPTLCATSYLQPAGQFSVPAIITPVTSPSGCNPPTPSYPDYVSCPSMPPSVPMPPVIITRDDDDWQHLLYFLIFALTRNKGGNGCGNGGNYNCGFGGCNGCGGCGCGGCGCGGCGCGGCCCCCCGCGGNCCGGCDGGCGCVYPYDKFSNFGGNNGDNSGGNNGDNFGGKKGGPFGGNNGNIATNIGGDVIYVPYPIAVPINSPFPGISFPNPDSPDSCPPPSCNSDCKDEINFIIRTDCK